MQHLFDGQLEFSSEEKLHEFLQSINIEETIQLLEIGLNQASEKGSFSIKEAVTMDSCLRKLRSVFNEHQREESVPDKPIPQQDV